MVKPLADALPLDIMEEGPRLEKVETVFEGHTEQFGKILKAFQFKSFTRVQD